VCLSKFVLFFNSMTIFAYLYVSWTWTTSDTYRKSILICIGTVLTIKYTVKMNVTVAKIRLKYILCRRTNGVPPPNFNVSNNRCDVSIIRFIINVLIYGRYVPRHFVSTTLNSMVSIRYSCVPNKWLLLYLSIYVALYCYRGIRGKKDST